MQVLQLAFERDAHRHRKTAQVGKLPGQPQQRIAAANLAANRGEGLEGCGKSVGPGGRRVDMGLNLLTWSALVSMLMVETVSAQRD